MKRLIAIMPIILMLCAVSCKIKPDVTVDKVDVTIDLASLTQACSDLAGPCRDAGIADDQCGFYIYQQWVATMQEKADQENTPSPSDKDYQETINKDVTAYGSVGTIPTTINTESDQCK